ncbi:hypothetical protein [Mycolicibacterium aromaticivorans]|nr:hypothetical protein [Mycolicibacterium aromaticivorans]
MADGLDSLTAMRTKTPSKRAVPPPRHQPRRTPVEMPSPGGQQSDAKAPDPARPTPSVTPTSKPAPPEPIAPAAANNSDLTKVSIYLDEQSDAYLETVRSAARNTRPRVDATRSAVVRLALTRLADELDAAEVIAELQRNAAGHTGPGRKRG